MSFLHLRSPALGAEYALNCTSFSSGLSSLMSSVQTKTMAQHFPVKAQQPEVDFDIVFRDEATYEEFQEFVRQHQLKALRGSANPEVVLWWPQRDINNWTGLIKNFKAGGQRFNPAPRARLTVDLVDSVYSLRTHLSSIAAPLWTIAGYGSSSGMLQPPTGLGTGVNRPGRGIFGALG